MPMSVDFSGSFSLIICSTLCFLLFHQLTTLQDFEVEIEVLPSVEVRLDVLVAFPFRPRRTCQSIRVTPYLSSLALHLHRLFLHTHSSGLHSISSASILVCSRLQHTFCSPLALEAFSLAVGTQFGTLSPQDRVWKGFGGRVVG
ncbi:hypothetical protein C8R45DRAFT_297828 [Mycena sanguinolenta]|nr:hypothetical protein C8R45DRAFT_297828 [Mycena sanguinolenta]